MNNYLMAAAIFAFAALLAAKARREDIHYQNSKHGTRTKNSNRTKAQAEEDAIDRGEEHTENPDFGGLYAKRGYPSLPFQAGMQGTGADGEYSVDIQRGGTSYEEWLAQVEHQSFIEEMRMDLERGGIMMGDLGL
jgi:hypothetical protein